MKVIECVPNFSEGRDPGKIKSLVDEIQSPSQVVVLDVSSGKTTNRTVVTFIGTPEGIKEGAFRGIKKASQIIDMRKHQGIHMRMGATDVCPLVPVKGVDMKECIQISHELGQRVALELNIPVFLYEKSAQFPERRSLSQIRKGQWEAMCEKIKDPRWTPDYGGPIFNAKSGATAIGARNYLIALNFNLNTQDKKTAHKLAVHLRERGGIQKDSHGNIVRNKQGKPIRIPGKFKAVKAIGWYVDDFKRAQISINFTDFQTTPPHIVYEEAKKEAKRYGVEVTGCELVGLIPKQALLMAGRYYLQEPNQNHQIPEKDLITAAVDHLGLNEVTPFDPNQKIIEYQILKYKNTLQS